MTTKGGTNSGGNGVIGGAVVVVEEQPAEFLMDDALAPFGIAPAVAQKFFLFVVFVRRRDNQRALPISQAEVNNFFAVTVG